jgi:hypothetical protein
MPPPPPRFDGEGGDGRPPMPPPRMRGGRGQGPRMQADRFDGERMPPGPPGMREMPGMRGMRGDAPGGRRPMRPPFPPLPPRARGDDEDLGELEDFLFGPDRDRDGASVPPRPRADAGNPDGAGADAS